MEKCLTLCVSLKIFFFLSLNLIEKTKLTLTIFFFIIFGIEVFLSIKLLPLKYLIFFVGFINLTAGVNQKSKKNRPFFFTSYTNAHTSQITHFQFKNTTESKMNAVLFV